MLLLLLVVVVVVEARTGSPLTNWLPPPPPPPPAQKDRVRTCLAEVAQALADEDQHVAFKTSKFLRPWQPARKVQLKSPDGYLLSPVAELKALTQYATGVYASHPPLLPLTGRLPQLPVVNLNNDKHIQSIKTGKAIFAGSATAAAWRPCCYEVAEALLVVTFFFSVFNSVFMLGLVLNMCTAPHRFKPCMQHVNTCNSRLLHYFFTT